MAEPGLEKDFTDEEPQVDIRAHRRYLLSVARMQLRDPMLAEDVVQETLLAAIAGLRTYQRRSSMRTWLTGILKYKLLDALRSQGRVPTPVSTLKIPHAHGGVARLFDENGCWWSSPAPWEDPDRALTQADFLKVMEACLARLSPVAARVFLQREVMDMGIGEIAEAADIGQNHLGVILYRARMALRECLTENWFANGERKS